MGKIASEYQTLLMQRYGSIELDKLDKIALSALKRDPAEDGYEEEMLQWMKNNPNATFQELLRFNASFYCPLEIVDDDDMDE